MLCGSSFFMAHVSRIRKKLKPTRDAADHSARVFWKEQVDDMVRRTNAKRVYQQKECQEFKGKKTPLGYNVCNYTYEDYIIITHQYGQDAITNPEFIRDYNRLKDLKPNSI